MRADTLLLLLQRIASNQARTLNPRQSKRAARANSALSQLRKEANQSPEIRSTVRRVLAIVRTLLAPSRQRKAQRNPAERRGRGRPEACTIAKFKGALSDSGGSKKGAAKLLGISRSTATRMFAQINGGSKMNCEPSRPSAPNLPGE